MGLSMTLYTRGIKSSFGALTLIADDNALLAINFTESLKNDSSKILDQTEKELMEYFMGKRKNFTVTVNPQGSAYQKHCWEKLQSIPYGHTISYKQQAVLVAGGNHTRAVASANNRNPIPIIIPCHRVIGSDGKLVGYAGGLELKARLLQLEQQEH